MSLLAQTRPDDGAHTHSLATMVPDSTRGERPKSFDVETFAVPGGREEDWRFTPIDRLGRLFRDEGSNDRLTSRTELPEGVTLTEVDLATARALGLPEPADRAAVMAANLAPHVDQLTIPAGAELTDAIRLHLDGTGGTVFRHVVIDAGVNSHATVVVQYSGSAQLNELLSVVARDGSHLTVVTVQEWAREAIHLGEHDLSIGRDATLRHIAVTLGGGIVRLSTNASYAGPGGHFEGLGVYFADSGQHLEHRLFVDHDEPHCVSNVEYKGALQGDTAHTVWVGDVLIRAGADGTETYELNRNLLLSEGARADSVPNLEIETGEIAGAGHASATGRFDDLQLFYLMTRGIPEDDARRLVVRGFFASVIQRIGIPEITDHLMELVEAELAQGGSLPSAPVGAQS